MKKIRRLPGGRTIGTAVEDKKPSRKKRHSVLVQRAVIFTALVMLAAVAIGSPVYHLVDRYSSLHTAKAQAEPMLDMLYGKLVFDDGQFQDHAELLGAADIAVWRCNVIGNEIRWNGENGSDQLNTEEARRRLMAVYESEEPRREAVLPEI